MSNSRDPMQKVFRLVSNGQLEQAEDYCRQVVDDDPGNVNILGMLGAILLKQNKIGESETCLLQTIELAPAFAKPHEDLGMLYLSQNQPEKAANYFEHSVRLDPTQASAYFGLANALVRIGRREAAELAHRKYLELSPAARSLTEASRLRSAGELRRAEQLCEEVLQNEPENIEALRMLAQIASEDGRHVFEERHLRRILQLSPKNPASNLELGRFLVDAGRVPEAVEFIRTAVDLEPANFSNHLAQADTLSMLGRHNEALQSYQRCLELRPEEPSAWLGMGHILRIRGRRDEAISAYRRCTELRPDSGTAYWSLASLKDFRFADAELAAMRQNIAGGELDPESEIGFRFALARACESAGDFDAAWAQYELGNGLKRSRIQYDPVETETKHDKILKVFTAEFLDREIKAQPVSPTPIFILGIPRSGSTLIEQILASHSMVAGAGELPRIAMLSASLGGNRPDGLAYPEVLREMSDAQLAAMGKSYVFLTEAHRHEDLPFFTDKMPANFPHVGFIHLILPHARIIDARRDPIDTCVGNYRQLFALGKNHSYDLQEVGEYYLQYLRVMDHWDRVLPGRVLRVRYEDVVNDLEGQVRRILDHCELPFEGACLDFFRSDRDVNTASSEQVRQPIYTDAIQYWKNYEKHLGELLEVLAPVLN